MRIRLAAAGLAAAALAALLGTFGRAHSATAPACGVERWSIKTLTDQGANKINFEPKRTTVRVLRRLRAPDRLGEERIGPVELQSYQIEAELVTAIHEDDSDIHLVVVDPGASARSSMIVELPDPACTTGAFGRRALTRARRAFENACGLPSRKGWSLDGRATITGVGFWDFDHGQRGVAPNAIELHPLTGFHATRCERQRGGVRRQ